MSAHRLAPPAAILFDLDGTLIDTYRLYLECYRRALEPHLGYAPTDKETAARRPASERRFLTDWLGERRGLECHAQMTQLYGELFMMMSEDIYPGVHEMLTALHTAGLGLGIVTGKGRDAWDVTRVYSDVGNWDVVITDDDVHAAKPDPGGLLAAVEALGITPQQAVYIGDSPVDMKAGRNAGMRIGAALWAKTEPGEAEEFVRKIAAMNPDWIFGRPSDVTRAFATWC
ncbi:HAD family hydrolase [Longimicrobium sp.]|uniref:HAD family hydrolase n=1 Tax=Longimicrobium sp. TaxID=2029185 RepID=UPI003B3A19B0